MKFKKPTLGQVVLYTLLALSISASIYFLFSSLSSILYLTAFVGFLWISYKLYKSTPSQRASWGRKNKFLGFIFKADKDKNTMY